MFSVNLRSLFIVFIVCLFTACAPVTPIVSQSKDVIVGKSDARQYRGVVLSNGLKVMLVSDPKAEYGAASLDVNVGSSSDPAYRQGLAHFLEHMLFLGTHKYPLSDEYMQFIEDNGGGNNAYTSQEHTNYFFDVKPSALEPALDRFAQFFISPLLNEDYVEREKNAVHSEYRAGIKDDSRRVLDVIREVMNPAHPNSHFSVGNLTTLSSEETPITNDLQRFFDRYYAANNMALSVLGTQSLDELEQMVRKRFSAIKAKGDVVKPAKEPFFAKENMGKVIWVKPEKSTQSLNLLFPINEQVSTYRSKPADVVSYVLGDEGEGSLLAYLKSKNLATSVAVSSAFNYKGGALLGISVTLTEHGDSRRQEVLAAVFETINRLKDKEWMERLFNEMAAINRLNFDYADKDSERYAVMSMASNMHYYVFADVLSADYLMTEYRPDLMKEIISQLTIKNSVILSVSKNSNTNKLSEYYQVPYAVTDLPKEWEDAIGDAGLNAEIQLPKPNPFLPESFKVQSKHSKSSYPTLIIDEPGVQLWHKGIDLFALPKATTQILFSKSDVRSNAKKSVLLDVYIALLNDEISSWLYPVQISNLHVGLYASVAGINIKLTGFSDKQDELLEQMLDRIVSAKITQDQYDRVLANLIKDVENSLKTQPYRRLDAELYNRLKSPSYSTEQTLEQLRKLTLHELERFSQGIWKDTQISAIVDGNITAKKAKSMILTAQKMTGQNVAVKRDLKIVRLPVENSREQVTVDHQDAAYVLYWQAKRKDLDSVAKYMLLGKALETPFFSELRTQQQLGYVVYGGYDQLEGVSAVKFTVQSPEASVEKIHDSVLKFISHAKAELYNLKPEYLLQLQQSLAHGLREKPLTLDSEALTFWHHIQLHGADFERQERLAHEIEDITIDDWRDFIARLYRNPYTRMLLITTPSQPLQYFSDEKGVEGSKKYFEQK